MLGALGPLALRPQRAQCHPNPDPNTVSLTLTP